MCVRLEVGSRPGPSTANVDGFRLTVKGDGGHGAYPHRGIDPVTLAARMVLAFQSIVSREIDVNRHAVISVGRIEGGAKSNVIPSEVAIDATYEWYDRFGSLDAAQNYILNLMTEVSAIYESELNIALEVPYLRVFTTPKP